MKFEIKASKKDLFLYQLYYFYSKFSGIISFILGILAFAGGIFYLVEGNKSGVFLILAGVLLVFIQPFLLYTKAAKQIQLPVLKNGSTYEFDEEGIHVSQGENKADLTWDKISSWVCFAGEYFIFIDQYRANIVPKSALNGQEEKVMELVRKNLPKSKVKGK